MALKREEKCFQSGRKNDKKGFCFASSKLATGVALDQEISPTKNNGKISFSSSKGQREVTRGGGGGSHEKGKGVAVAESLEKKSIQTVRRNLATFKEKT